jgi:hypothetical protein
MNFVLGITLLVFSKVAFAESDTLAIFWKSPQTTVIINESETSPKLKNFIQSAGLGSTFSLQSKTGDITVQCKSFATAASCTFKLTKSNEVDVREAYVYAYSDSSNTSPFRIANLVQADFENAKGERFSIWLDQFQIAIQAQKP